MSTHNIFCVEIKRNIHPNTLLSGAMNNHIFRKYLDGQAWAISEESDQMLQNMASIRSILYASHPGPSCSKLTMLLVNVSFKL